MTQQSFPYDGPHSPDTVHRAAEILAYLVRYLNNATGAAGATVPHAATVDRVLGSLGAAVAGLDQLLAQLAPAIERQAKHAALYDDRCGCSGDATGAELVTKLGVVRGWSARLAHEIDAARAASTHLGNANPQ